MQNADQAMVDVDGYTLAVRTVSATVAGRPPVVLLSGLGCDASGWARVVHRLRPGPRLVLYDRANLGDSPPRPAHLRTTTYQGLAAELEQLLTAVGVDEPAVLVGHSMGSLVVRLYAATWPDWVAGTVHVDGSVPEVLVRSVSDNYDGTPSPESTWIDHRAGAVEVAEARLDPHPSVVLVRTPGRWRDPLPDADELWDAGQQHLAEQLGACRVDAVDSGHWMHTEVTGLVTLAIDAVLETVAEGRSSVHVDPAAAAAAGGQVTMVPA